MKQRTMVAFLVSEDGKHIVERMHALVREDGNFVLDNSPFYTFGISCGDVFAASSGAEGELIFSKVVSRGGHSTYRIKLPPGSSHEDFLVRWPALEKLGCTYEGSSANSARLYSIDIPAGTNVFEVYRLLEEGEQEKAWFFEEGHYFKPT